MQYFRKTIFPDNFNFPDGTRTVTLLDGYSKGVGFTAPVAKTAGDVDSFIRDIKPDKDHSYVHLISIGAQEFYGPNKRGDSFNEATRVYRPPAPWSKEATEITLEGGLKEFHNPTFMANGKVYLEHRSVISDPRNKPRGDVVFATYNEPMHRGELIIRLPRELWESDIKRLEDGKPMYFSMGCLTASDVCSVCGKRTSPNDLENRCDHLRNNILSYMANGTQVHAITDHPIFYDISRVAVPADKIAFSLGKVASDNTVPSFREHMPTLPASLVDRIRGRRADRVSLVVKAAAEERYVSSSGMDLPVTTSSDEEGKLLDSLSKDAPKVIFILNKRKAVLPPPQFIRLVGGCGDSLDSAMPLIGSNLENIFNEIMGGGDLASFIDDGTYEGEETTDQELMRKVAPLISRYSLEEEPVTRRIVQIVVAPSPKFASERKLFTPGAGEMAAKLAREYARYQLSFMTENPDNRSIHLTLAHNHGNVTLGW